MLTTANIEFYAAFLNSLIVRRPVLVSLGRGAEGVRLRNLLSLVPDHRWLLVTGEVPKWAKYLPNQPRDLPADDLEDLRTALLSTFEEERMGRRAVQLIYFSPDGEAYERVLKDLSKGWIAIAKDLNPIIDRLPQDTERFEVDSRDGFFAVHLGTEPAEMEFESGVLRRAINRNENFAVCLVQKKLSDMHLAGNAVVKELEESSQSITLVDLEEIFELNQSTIEKQFQLVEAERDVDLRKYLPAPPMEVVQTAEALCGIPHVVAVAAAKAGSVICLRRLRSTSLGVSHMSVILSEFLKDASGAEGLGDCRHLLLSAKDGTTVVTALNGEMSYCVFFGSEAKPGLAISGVREILKSGASN